MTQTTHEIVVHGPAVTVNAVPARVFRDLLGMLVDGAERSLRLRIEGRSSAKGPVPGWLRPASDFSLIHAPGAAANRAVVEAKSLVETMPGLFRQGDMFSDLDPRKSSIELFEDALADALAGDEDSERYDMALVNFFEGFEGLFEQGVDRIDIVNGRSVHVTRESMANLDRLAGRTYPTQRVRVAGTLEQISYSKSRFSLVLQDRSVLAGTAIELGTEVLRQHFGQAVVVTGKAAFRPSGKALRIEAEHIDLAKDRDIKIWSAAPKPLLAPVQTLPRGEERAKKGLAALFEKWPGDETDEEVAAALKAVS